MTDEVARVTAAAEAFDVCGELPTGTTMLEASAGTGKTFTIAALAARYVAEGRVQLGELMLVTFGRAATRELRERVRGQLVSAERALADPVSARAGGDDLVRFLAGVDDEEVALRRKRLRAALIDFDAATIDTTHAFCQQMLTGLGIAADDDPGGTFVESVDDVILEVVDDLYVRKWGSPGSEPPLLSLQDARALARRVVNDRHAVLEPADALPDTAARQRVAFARAVRTGVGARKRRRRLRDFDDLLTRLHRSLTDPQTGAVAQQRIRSRFRVVMVDEFQDTDPVQWDILRLAFHGRTTLVLIGDPKQSIYAFRGGDVTTYLAAAAQATTERTLARNWRSDAGLLTALEQVFGGAALGHPRILVRPVDAEYGSRRLTGAPSDAALRIRVAPRKVLGEGSGKTPGVEAIRGLVAADVTRDIVELLGSRARLHLDGVARPVVPGDIAVLVGTNRQAAMVHTALSAAGVPAVLSGTVSVYTTQMATQWLVLLRALEQPHRAGSVKAAALTHFVGWDGPRLAAAGAEAMEELGPMLSEWADVLERRGLPALLEVITERCDLPGRLLGYDGGERLLTDLRHVAETLHQAVTTEHVGSSALVEWLRKQIELAQGDPTEERSRRLESDADAVQVVTVHRSKGLEFPVTYVPYGWDKFAQASAVPRFHTEAGVRSIDVGGLDGAAYAEHCAADAAEEAGEDLRALYVALTRAQCQVVTWWVASLKNTKEAPLHRLLFGGHAPGEQPDDSVPVLSDDRAIERLTALSAASGGHLAVEAVDPLPASPVRWQPPVASAAEMAAAKFDRRLDTTWRRLSYTGLTSAAYQAAHAPGVTGETEEPRLDDETPVPAMASTAAGADEAALRAVTSAMGDLPTGTALGILVHSVLELVDTTAPDLATEIAERCREVLDRRLTRAVEPEALAAALLPAMRTPLGPLMDGRRLAEVVPGDRLAELDFELPLAGGDNPVAAGATLRSISDLLRRRLPADDPFTPYADRLDALDDHRLRGYLVGSLDVVLRTPRPDGQPRYVVADYKTNWLGDAYPGSGEPLTAWHYRPDAVTAAMLSAHYPLQALLYLVALHRYLRWRQPGYEPDLHLGGALYLFVRGMCGPQTPVIDGIPCGVFGWRPPSGFVAELSALLAGGPR